LYAGIFVDYHLKKDSVSRDNDDIVQI
jgi:hypothetical protein